MKKLITLLSLALVAICLSACGSNPPTKDVTKVTYERVPATLIQDCPVEPPPTKEVYYGLVDWQAREHMLMEIISKEIVNLSNCNVNKQQLRDWDQKQYDLFQNPPVLAPDTRSSNDAGRYSAWYTG